MLIQEVYESEGEFCFSDEYSYDEYQNLIKTQICNRENRYSAYDEENIIYQYDRHGNWVTKKFYEDKKLKEIIKREIEYFE